MNDLNDDVLRLLRESENDTRDLFHAIDENKALVHQQHASNGWTLLHLAVAYGRVSVVEHLMPLSDVNHCNNFEKQTPLMIAIERNQMECAKALLPCSNLALRNEEMETAFLMACSKSPLELVDLLRPRSDVHVRNRQGSGGLIYALSNKDERVFERLIPWMDVNEQNEHGTTALMICACRGLTKPLEVLMKVSDLTLKNHRQDDALTCAIRSNHLDAVKLLLPKTPLWDEKGARLFSWGESVLGETGPCFDYVNEYIRAMEDQRELSALVESNGVKNGVVLTL